MINSALPVEKFPELVKYFPENQLACFFGGDGELNDFGEMAMELLAMKQLFECASFIADRERGVMYLIFGSVAITGEEDTNALKLKAREYSERNQIKVKEIRVAAS